ncbi:MAG: hypothetical protein WDN75_01115 [Bacteroidota bacterium]
MLVFFTNKEMNKRILLLVKNTNSGFGQLTMYCPKPLLVFLEADWEWQHSP